MTTRTERKARTAKLRINPIACDGVGMCSHVAPDLITVDKWGFPVLTAEPVDASTMRQARAAVAVCPVRALFLEQPKDS